MAVPQGTREQTSRIAFVASSLLAARKALHNAKADSRGIVDLAGLGGVLALRMQEQDIEPTGPAATLLHNKTMKDMVVELVPRITYNHTFSSSRLLNCLKARLRRLSNWNDWEVELTL